MAEQVPRPDAQSASSRWATDTAPLRAGQQHEDAGEAAASMGFATTATSPYQAHPPSFPESRSRQASAGNSAMMYTPTSMPAAGEGSFAMSSMAESLPSHRPPTSVLPGSHVPRYAPSASGAGFGRQHLPDPSFAGPGGFHQPGYNAGFPSQYAAYSQGTLPGMTAAHFPQHGGSHQRPDLVNPMLTQYTNQPFYGVPSQVAPPYAMYSPTFYRQLNPTQQEFSGRLPRQQEGSMGQMVGSAPPSSMMGYGAPGNPASRSGTYARQGSLPQAAKPAAIPSTPRGPPRKPKQSGHALWVGNLPPGTLIVHLKDHFSREATHDIESVFLISKSNCAFVNYRSEAACLAAMTRFHDSRFQGVRLVCRLRRGTTSTAATPGVPTGPAALAGSSAAAPPSPQTAVEAITQNREISSRAEEVARQADSAAPPPNKYFIVKSLTIEDLELSARTGVWATQAHNEEAFNRAYESVPNVYLIFSGNKTGEYFGYARMASPISDAAAAELDWQPHTSTQQATAITPATTSSSAPAGDVPRFIITPPTEHAPAGRIIDDSARGTIFWEADPPADAAPTDEDTNPDSSTTNADVAADEPALEPGAVEGAPPFGKPFRVEWLSTTKVPFYRTRGLRNPWNANREVKIARDGTELETSLGMKLIALFETGGPSVGAGPGSAGGAGSGGRFGMASTPGASRGRGKPAGA